jgi:hypothetical protein
VSDNPTTGVEAPETLENRTGIDHPTTELSRPSPPRAGDQPAASDTDAPTRAFTGFRTEQRWPASDARAMVPPTAPAAMPPWDSTPVTGIPRVDPAGFGGYHGGPTEAHARPVDSSYRPELVPHTPYPELSTSMLLRPVKPPPSEGWRRLLYVLSGQLINVGESPRAARYHDLVARANRPLRGCYRIAMV